MTQALKSGYGVTAFVRNPERLGDLREKVRVVEGVAADVGAIGRAVSGSEAVLSTLGGGKGSPKDLLSSAVSRIVDAMKERGARRLVVLANIAVRDPGDSPTLAQKVIRGALRIGKSSVWLDSVREAEVIGRSGLDWTIVRASMLTDGPLTGKYAIGTLAKGVPLRVSRADVAHFMLSCVESGRYVGQRPVIGGG